MRQLSRSYAHLTLIAVNPTLLSGSAEGALIQMAKMAKSKTIQLPVSARALKQRINRKLKPHQQLKEAREGSLIYKDCGRYFVIDHRIAAVLSRFTDLDLEKFGRELGVLSPAERLDDDKS